MSERAAKNVYRAQAVPPGVRLKLDANELPGADPAWFAGFDPERAARYPESGVLEHLIARRHATTTDRVLVTAGGDEAIERLTRVAAGPDAPVVAATPTFEMIPRYAVMAGARFVGVPWADDSAFPVGHVLKTVAAEGAGLLALVTPNNPTGRVIARAEAERMIAAASCPVMLDLAYAEFAADDLTDLAVSGTGVVAIRTFSKAWGLAGLRVGYAVGDPGLIESMRSAGGPYSVSGIARAVAERALSAYPDWLDSRLRRVHNERSRLVGLCSKLGLAVLPSEANFVLIRSGRAERLWQGLLDRGVLVRRWHDRPGLADALRISIPAEAADADTLMRAIESAVGQEDAR
ncbi:MAG: histidinol-phosphate transaminase [Planctomycetota bacterium]